MILIGLDIQFVQPSLIISIYDQRFVTLNFVAEKKIFEISPTRDQ